MTYTELSSWGAGEKGLAGAEDERTLVLVWPGLGAVALSTCRNPSTGGVETDGFWELTVQPANLDGMVRFQFSERPVFRQ